MSIIVWDGRVLAADKQVTNGNLRRTGTKIFRHGDMLIGFAGILSACEQVRNWIMKGCDPEDFPILPPEDQADVWIINRSGTVAKFERSPFPTVYTDKFFADGSGRDFAYGALEMGASAEHAVSVAIKYDIHCGGGVDTLTFDE